MVTWPLLYISMLISTHMSEESVQALGAAIDAAQSIVCFTGAGISTESGIPDFRSPGTGLWNKIRPIQFQDFIASEEARQESWQRKFSGDRSFDNATPNKGHEALARLVEILTQAGAAAIAMGSWVTT